MPLLRCRACKASEPGSAVWVGLRAVVVRAEAGGCRVARRGGAVRGLPDFRGGRAFYGWEARWPVPSFVEGAGCFSVTGSALGDFRVRMGNWPYGVWCGEMRW